MLWRHMKWTACRCSKLWGGHQHLSSQLYLLRANYELMAARNARHEPFRCQAERAMLLQLLQCQALQASQPHAPSCTSQQPSDYAPPAALCQGCSACNLASCLAGNARCQLRRLACCTPWTLLAHCHKRLARLLRGVRQPGQLVSSVCLAVVYLRLGACPLGTSNGLARAMLPQALLTMRCAAVYLKWQITRRRASLEDMSVTHEA